MKKLVLLSLAIGLSFLSMAQAPQLINYQAVIRDATGQVVQNQNVSLRLSIHEKYSVGINVYQEEHMVTTNDFGLVNLHIGNGVNKVGQLNNVKWGNDVHVLKVSLDQNGGSSFSVMGYAQLVSVPYALYAANVSYSDTSATNELQMLSFSNDTLRLSNGNSIYLPNTDYSKNISDLNDSIMIINSRLVSITQQVKNDSIYLAGLIIGHINSDADLDSTNEIQNLSIAGNTLTISKGNSVVLPGGASVNNDNDSTNELITTVTFTGTTLSISDAGGSKTVNLASLLDNTDAQTLSISGNTLSIGNGNSVTLPTGGTSNDNDSTNEYNTQVQFTGSTLTITDGGGAKSANLSALLDNTDSQALSISGNTLSISGGNSVTLPAGGGVNNDNDSTNEIQSLSRSSDTLFISQSNYIVLPTGAVNTDDQNLNLSGDTLYIEDGTPVVLSKYLNTDGQNLSLSGNNLSISGGNSVTLPSGGSSNDNDSTNEIQNLSISSDTMFISKGNYVVLPSGSVNTDNQNLSLSGDTLYIEDGTAVLLSKYLDNTDSQNLSISGSTLSISGGNSVTLPAGGGPNNDNDSTNEIQNLSLSGNTLSISNGNSVTLASGAVNHDNDSTNELISSFILSNDTLSITDAAGTKQVGLGTYLDNTDAQALTISGDTIYLSNGGFVKLPAGGGVNNDNDSTNEIQSLTLSGNTLSISNGNSVTLASGAVNHDNDSTNELISAFILTNDTLSITDASGTKQVGLATYMDNTDAQALSLSGDTIYLSNGGFVKLPAATSGYDGDSSSTNELQTLSISGNNLSLSNGNTIALPAGGLSNDNDSTNEYNSSMSLSGSTLSVTDGGGAKSVNVSSLLDNTDSQTLSLSGSTLSISGGNNVTLPSGTVSSDNDSTNELNSSVSVSGNILSVTDAGGAKTADLSAFKDNTDSQTLSLSGSTLSIAGGNSVTLPAGTASNDNDSTNELNSAFAITSNNLTVTDAGGAKTVSLAPYLDNTDAQTLSITGNTLSITGGNNVTLPSGSTYTTKGIDSVLTAGNNAAGLNMLNVGKMAIGTATADSTLTVSGGINANNIRLSNGAGANKVLTSDASGNASWVSPTTVAAPSEIKDTDNDTKIQVEESADEDIIRFDIAGNERWRMEGTRIEPVGTGGSVFIGDNAGQSDDLSSNNNTFIGNNSGQTNTTGSGNSAIGYNSMLSNTAGYSNSALGVNSMRSNTGGRENVTVGRNSMYNNTSGIRNTVIGYEALFTNTTGLGNVAMGYRALRTSSNKSYNVGIGYDALYNNNGTGNIGMGFYALRGNVSGNYNAAIGYRALGSNVSGQRNIAFGFYSALDMLTGSYNITIGDYALNNNINGSNNVVVGRNAGYTNLTGSRNVFIGYQAGYSESGTDKLYIDASTTAASSTSPLIYGDFAADELKINGDLEVRDDFIVPTGAGAGKILTSDANGKASWSNPGAVSLGDTTQVSDLDGDTKIQMEESSDEDIIRFDLAGKEQWVMKGAQLENFNSGNSVFIGEEAGRVDDLSANENVFVGYRSGRSNTTGAYNTAVGGNSLRSNTTGSFNTSSGRYSLYGNLTGQQNSAYGYYSMAANNSGSYNSAFGYLSLRLNSTGRFNSATGYYAMYNNRTGEYNAAVGANALRQNSTGYRNAAVGYAALYYNTTGYRNSGMGMYALFRTSTGYDNAASGYYALGFNSTGYQNTAMGVNSLYQNTTGNNNAALGFRAGYYGQTGTQNTYLGAYAGPSSNATYNNSISLGYNSTTSASNQVRIGNSSVTSIGGQVGWTTISDGRFKENVKADVAGLDFIMKLTPVTYTLKTEEIFNQLEDKDSLVVSEEEIQARIEKSKIVQTGFIAQDVEKAAQEAGYSFSGVDAPKNDKDIYGLRYSEFVVPLVKAMQQQQEMIQAQQELIKKLEQRINALEK